MNNNENINQQNEKPLDNPLQSVQTADPATQNRNFELNNPNDKNGK